MVSMDILFAERVTIHLRASLSPAPVTATGLRSTMPVRTATTGRQFRDRTTSTRGPSTSLRAATTRATTAAATTGSLFALSKGLLNSEHKRAYPILQFFNSFRSLLWHPLRIEKGNVVERAASPFKTTREPRVVRGLVERAACAFMTQKQQVCLKQFKGKVYENNEPN